MKLLIWVGFIFSVVVALGLTGCSSRTPNIYKMNPGNLEWGMAGLPLRNESVPNLSCFRFKTPELGP
jgi:hypothetical protein